MKTRSQNNQTISIPRKIARDYPGGTAAIVNGKVMAGGKNAQEAISNAQKRYPDVPEWEISLASIPPRDGVWVV